MARLQGGKKLRRNKRKSLYRQVKSRRYAKTKPILPRKGLNQTSYEHGFFDFLHVFWENNQRMNLCNLTKQVANAWNALLSTPKINPERVAKDYKEEYEAMQRKKENESENMRKTDSDSDIDSQRRYFEDGSTSQMSGKDMTETDDRDNSEESQTDASEVDSVDGSERSSEYGEENKKKRKGRKYDSYEDYLQSKKIKSEKNSNNEHVKKEGDNRNSGGNGELSSGEKKGDQTENKQQESIMFPTREGTSIERIAERRESTLNSPTNLLHIKNLATDIKLSDLQDLFKTYLNDIVSIKILETEIRREALIEFKSVEAAQHVWGQMLDVECKRLPIILEFAVKEDFVD